MHDLDEIKERIPIAKAWELLQLPGQPAKRGASRSPFRDEKRPSFSVFNNGKMWKDHGTGETGDVVDFWCKATGIEKGAAIKELAKLAGVSQYDHCFLPVKKFAKLGPKVDARVKSEPASVGLVPENCSRNLRWLLSTHSLSFDIRKWLAKKRIEISTASQLTTEHAIGVDEHWRMCFFFEGGTKIRRVLEDSHSCVWTEGSSASLPWRIRRVDNPDVKTVFITEGESDLMRTASHISPVGGGKACIISMPSASWRPDPALCWRIGAYRDVVLLMDEDKAGRLCLDALAGLFCANAKGVRLWRPSFPDKSDCCDLPTDKLLKAFDTMKRIN